MIRCLSDKKIGENGLNPKKKVSQRKLAGFFNHGHKQQFVFFVLVIFLQVFVFSGSNH